MPLPKKSAVEKPTINKTAIGKPEEVSVTVRLPKGLHTRLIGIGASEGKTLADVLNRAAREHAARYERTSQTVTAYTRKKD